MCACGSSFGPDRYGPLYRGRYAFLGAQPARTPWTEAPAAPAAQAVDPSCPNCRVGAYSAGEFLPPVPFGQRYVMDQLGSQVPGPMLSVPPQLQPLPAFAWPLHSVPVARLR